MRLSPTPTERVRCRGSAEAFDQSGCRSRSHGAMSVMRSPDDELTMMLGEDRSTVRVAIDARRARADHELELVGSVRRRRPADPVALVRPSASDKLPVTKAEARPIHVRALRRAFGDGCRGGIGGTGAGSFQRGYFASNQPRRATTIIVGKIREAAASASTISSRKMKKAFTFTSMSMPVPVVSVYDGNRRPVRHCVSLRLVPPSASNRAATGPGSLGRFDDAVKAAESAGFAGRRSCAT